MPENWVQRPVVNTEEGSNPGAPLAWGSPENPDDAVAGYGYVAAKPHFNVRPKANPRTGKYPNTKGHYVFSKK